VRRALEEAALRWTPAAAIVEVRSGDAVLVAADDPVALAQMARHLMDDVYQAPGHPRLRIALHHGEVQTRQGDTDEKAEIVGGDAILCAARVEPIVEPGQIWATEAFRAQFLERPSLWRTSPLAAPSGDELFNVKKKGSSEPDSWVRLFRLES
jgi:class 3 adenylate cyclase